LLYWIYSALLNCCTGYTVHCWIVVLDIQCTVELLYWKYRALLNCCTGYTVHCWIAVLEIQCTVELLYWIYSALLNCCTGYTVHCWIVVLNIQCTVELLYWIYSALLNCCTGYTVYCWIVVLDIQCTLLVTLDIRVFYANKVSDMHGEKSWQETDADGVINQAQPGNNHEKNGKNMNIWCCSFILREFAREGYAPLFSPVSCCGQGNVEHRALSGSLSNARICN